MKCAGKPCGVPPRNRLGVRKWLTGFVLSAACLSTTAYAQQQNDLPNGQVEEGVRSNVRRQSALAKLVPAEMVEQQAIKNYQKTLADATQKQELAPDTHVQVVRLRAIARRLIPFTAAWNPRVAEWQWEVNLLMRDEVNAWCMAGGKIAFFSKILSALQLTDDEVAVVMGHEIAHALREHQRKHLAESVATNMGANAVSSILGLQGLGSKAVSYGANLLGLKFNRSDESEADIVGLELAARAGYNPAAGITLWRKMGELEAGANRAPEYRNTHPSGERRIQQIEAILPKVMLLYEQADKPARTYGQPAMR